MSEKPNGEVLCLSSQLVLRSSYHERAASEGHWSYSVVGGRGHLTELPEAPSAIIEGQKYVETSTRSEKEGRLYLMVPHRDPTKGYCGASQERLLG